MAKSTISKSSGDVSLLSLQKIVANLPGYVYWLGLKGQVLGCNEKQAQNMGYKSSDDLVGKNLYECYEGTNLQTLINNNRAVITLKKERVFEEKFIYQGQEKTFLSTKKPLFADDGSVIGLLNFSIDITKCKIWKVENNPNERDDLEKAYVVLDDLFTSLPGNIYWLDKNNVYLGCNDEQAQIFGLKSRHDVVGKTNECLMNRKDVAEALDAVNNEVMRTGKTLVLEENGPGEDRETRYLTHKAPLRDKYGEIVGIVGVSLNITERKRVEDNLYFTTQDLKEKNKSLAADKEHYVTFLQKVYKQVTGIEPDENFADDLLLFIREYLENIIAQMPGHVYWVDKNNVYLGCNNLQAKHYGLKSHYDIVGKTNQQVFSKADAKAMNNNNLLVMRRGKEIEFEETSTMAHGTKYYLTHKVPLRTKSDEVIGMMGISFDITEKKEIELELKKAKERAETASHAKTEFILNMEHDIRTPIAHIISFSDILVQRDNLPEGQLKEYLGYINTSGRKLLDLITEILTFADIEQGNLQSELSYINVKQLIDDIVDLEMPAIVNKGLEIAIDCSNNVPLFYSDKIKLHRILLNLVSNAVKYTDKGYIKVSVQFKKIVGCKDKVDLMLVVEDSGIGIPEDKQAVVFDRFSKLIPSNKNKVRGLGLGLWIVKQFVSDLGGSIELKSKQHKGSVFTVTLPVKLSDNLK